MTSMNKQIPDWLILWIWNSLLGEIYPNIRAIAVAFSPDRELTMRYYLDRNPTDFDRESIADVMGNIFANTSSAHDIKSCKEECIYSKSPVGELDALGGLIYARREYNMAPP